MLSWYTLPASFGFTGYYDNVGDMRNTGVEFELQGDIIRTKELTWSAHLNMTANKNRIVRLAADKKNLVVDGKQGYQSSDYFYGEKLPMYTWYMYKYAGVDQTTGEALYYKNVYEIYRQSERNIGGKSRNFLSGPIYSYTIRQNDGRGKITNAVGVK